MRLKNAINPKNKNSYDDIKQIVEDEPNYKVEPDNTKNTSKNTIKPKIKKARISIDYSNFKIH